MTRPRLRPLPFALLVGVAACGDEATSPVRERPGAVQVTISAAVRGGYSVGWEGEDPTISCTVDMTASVAGHGSAIWRDAIFRFYVGPGGTTFVDSAVVEASDVLASWSVATITPGVAPQATWHFTAYVPFTAKVEYRYQSAQAPEQSATATFTCGPTTSPTAAAPEVTELSTTPPSGELPFGAPLTVQYVVTAPAGLWRIDLFVEGPCSPKRVFDERFTTSATRTLSLSLPRECQLGVPLGVRLAAMDAAGQVTSRTLQTPVVLADKEPPSIFPMFFPPGGGSAMNRLAGTYFGEDSIGVMFNANDNYRLAAVHWEVLPYGTRDSVLAVNGGIPWQVKIPLRAEWSGNIQLRLWARDAVGLTSDVVVAGGDSTVVYPYVAHPMRTATVGGETRDFAIDGGRGLIYLAQGNNHRLAIFSMATMQLVGTVALPAVPVAVDLTPSGDSAIVLLYGRRELAIVDVTGPTPVLSTLPLDWLDAAAQQFPKAARVGANGKVYLTTSGSSAEYRLLAEIDLGTGGHRVIPGAGGGGGVGMGVIEASLDRQVLVLNASDPWCTQRYVIARDAFGPCVQPLPRDGRPTVDGSGARFAISLDVYDATPALLPKSVPPLGLGAHVTTLSSDGETLFVMRGIFGVVKVRASDNRPIAKIARRAGFGPSRLSPDGNKLVSFDNDNNLTSTTITILDVR